jgi:hypothetical protein
MRIRTSAAIFFGTSCLLFAAEAPQQDELTHKVQVSETKRVAFPSGGTLRFRNSVGVLTVEAWDRPDVEITTIKSTKAAIGAGELEKARQTLDKVSVSAEQHGDELVVTTTFPRHRPFRLPYPLSGKTGFNLEYRIKAPASARIVADHTLGEVNIYGVTGDIQVTVAKGQILLHLPEEQKYSIQARCDFGSVNSDFSEPERRTRWLLGHISAETAAAPHKLNLKVGFGDIVILKTRVPKYPGPETPAPKADGL